MRYFLVLIFAFFYHIGFSQTILLTSDEALETYEVIRDSMETTFPSDDVKTYRRYSFTEKELQTYLNQIFKCLDLIPFIENHHNLKLEFYLHSGNWFRKIGFLKESIKSYQNFFKYYNSYKDELTKTEKDSYIKMHFYAYSILSENYALLNEFENAAKAHKANLVFSKPYIKEVYYPSALNNYGLYFYWYQKELDSAMYYFDKAYTITKTNLPNHKLIGSIRDNIADILVEKGKIDEAEAMYEANFEFYRYVVKENTGEKDIPRLISAGAQLIEANLKLGNKSKAEKTFQQLDSIVTSAKVSKELLSNSWIEFLNIKQHLLFENDNHKEAYETVVNLKSYTDSLQEASSKTDIKWRDELNATILDRIALNNKIDTIKKEKELEKQRSKLWIFILIFSIIVIMLLSLFLRRRQHVINAKNKQLLAEQTLENTELKVSQLNKEIKDRERDLSDFALNLTQNQEWAEMLVKKIQTIKTIDSKQRQILIEELERDIANKVAFDSNTKDFFFRLDKLSNAFYSKLTDQFPNLSKNEIRLCSLIRLKIDSRNIANLHNITLASLNTSRYRLRKKLELSEDEDLDVFIQNL